MFFFLSSASVTPTFDRGLFTFVLELAYYLAFQEPPFDSFIFHVLCFTPNLYFLQNSSFPISLFGIIVLRSIHFNSSGWPQNPLLQFPFCTLLPTLGSYYHLRSPRYEIYTKSDCSPKSSRSLFSINE